MLNKILHNDYMLPKYKETAIKLEDNLGSL